ncbi:MAG TPA: DUF4266 domain-containing protein [Alphaproteobacteria bacterium]|nr:DUF4266 domain-containing protein [Alphaproteobacteria bacterium]
MKITRSLLAVIGFSCLLSACSVLGVKPWDRDIMARKSMQLNTHPNLTAYHEHIYFSKEGSSGGRTFDGGGCGCN